jgi:hypothetical protein
MGWLVGWLIWMVEEARRDTKLSIGGRHPVDVQVWLLCGVSCGISS